MATVRRKVEKAAPAVSVDGGWAENAAIAAKLRDYADLLEQQGADGFRTRAYRRAADFVDALPRPIADTFAAEGRDGLEAMPNIGRGIAAAIAEMLTTGRWSQIERLRGDLIPQKLFLTIPGVGPELATRLADEHIETLEELENALHLGDLRVKGLGARRRAMLSAALAERLGRPIRRHAAPAAGRPPVELLLQVDRMYRDRAAAGTLRTIAPKRFNPAGEAWLPVMHARHEPWHFTALFSNTRTAHELGKTHDWVVVYFHRDGDVEDRCTVVTETRGPNAGRRVVRGREDETPAADNAPAAAEAVPPRPSP
ncbi:hypothetical protein RHIZO_02571 [Rhizobiaceae bacterium]|nr:hypothetical protein RHIZO_02571 [Rhizobiaceae bacterium]